MTEEQSSQLSVEHQILKELKKMNRVLTLVSGQKLENELSKYATTNERKKLWVLIDGKRDVNKLIEDSGLKRRSVYDFLEAIEKAGLIERPYGMPPERVIGFVPARWAEIPTAQVEKTLDETISVALPQKTSQANIEGDQNG